MANTVLGVGLLALPRAFAHGGIVWGVVCNTAAFGLNVFTNHLLAECHAAGGSRHADFKQLADAALPLLSIAVDIGVCINCLGAGCSYAIVATDSFHEVFGGGFGAGDGGGGRWRWTTVSLLIVLPLSFLRSMDSLRFTSAAAIACLAFILVVVVLYAAAPANLPLLTPCPDLHSSPSCPPGETHAVRPPVSTLSALSSLTMAYQCQMSTPTIANELPRPTRPRMLAIFTIALGTAWAMYLAVGLCGYATFGGNVTGNILDAYPDNPLVSAARVSLAVVVIFSYPLQAFVFRISSRTLLEAIAKAVAGSVRSATTTAIAPEEHEPKTQSSDDQLPRTDRWRVQELLEVFELEPAPAINASTFVIVTFAIAFTVTDLGVVVDLSGATGATMLAFVGPGFIYFFTFRRRRWYQPTRLASLVVGLFGIGSCVLGVALSLISEFEPELIEQLPSPGGADH